MYCVIMETYSWAEIWNWDMIDVNPTIINPDNFTTSRSFLSTVKIMINYSLLGILVIWLILISYLIYHKHKWEKWTWKKILKWDMIFFAIIFTIWFIVSLMFFLYNPSVKPVNI